MNYPIQYIFTQTQYPELIYENEKFQITTVPLKHRIPTTGFVLKEQVRDRKIVKEKIKEYQIPVHQFQRLKKGMDAEDVNGNIIVNELVTEPPPPPRKYTYLSDTAYMEKLPDITFHSDVLYHETTFLKEHKSLAQITMHSTTEDAAKTAIYTNAKKLVIGHFSSRYENLNPLLEETKSIFPDTELAVEGKRIKV
ncbi:MAG: hypothetical protein KatS3mg028_0003 [Bacteroidia bacterium]|nr:MAG: hypothetical protein KatS3mg028_0003 [Bacteroidia bacterium]